VDSPSRWGLPCLGFWFLNPSACQVCLHCIVYLVISYSCLAFCLRNCLFYPHIFSCYLEKLLQIYLWGWQLKARRAAAFLCWYFLTSLHEDRFGFTLHARIRCHFLFHKHVFVVFLFICFQQEKRKKIWGEFVGLFFFWLIRYCMYSHLISQFCEHQYFA
jgi:hypothetical protein